MTRVVVVGSGGREHALADVLARSAASVVVTPGNAGIPGSVDTPATEIDGDLYVVGPETPLVAGLADELRSLGRLVFGPGADGAQLEGSKAWMKDLLAAADVSTAAHGSFSDVEPALAFLNSMHDLFIVKTDGLAAGKGVLVTENRAEAEQAVHDYLLGEAFGTAGTTVVIEEGLTGPELSVLAICDGNRAVALAPAQDFKRALDGDRGPNTGGMGAYSPVPFAGDAVVDQVMERAVEPTLAELRRRGIDYRGVLYAGLMLTPDGLKVLEYNVRFGDPETQVVLPGLESDLVDLLASSAAGELGADPVFSTDSLVTVVCASEGYPVAPRTGDAITGVANAREIEGVSVYAAGVAAGDDGELVTAGGRVLNVVGRGANAQMARERAYAGVSKIAWPGMQYRSDIAKNIDEE